MQPITATSSARLSYPFGYNMLISISQKQLMVLDLPVLNGITKNLGIRFTSI